MKYTYFLCRVVAICILFLSGCMSVPNSPNPRFYSLQPLNPGAAVEKFNVAADTIIAVGPVRIPDYLNRPQIVTKDKKGMLTFAQFDRWGDPLDVAFTRLINADLAVMLPAASMEVYPWNIAIPVKYQVLVDVIRLESELDGELFLAVQWSIVDAQDNKMLLTRRSEFNSPVKPHTYSALADTLSRVFVSLSTDIAKAINSIPEKKKTAE